MKNAALFLFAASLIGASIAASPSAYAKKKHDSKHSAKKKKHDKKGEEAPKNEPVGGEPGGAGPSDTH